MRLNRIVESLAIAAFLSIGSSAVAQTGACCSFTGCSDGVSAGSCAGVFGDYLGDGTDCATASCTGVCCQPDGSCRELPGFACADTYQGNGTDCATFSCPQPTSGACCHPDGTCSDDPGLGAGCADNYRGDGTDCATESCPASGACCTPDGSCFEAPGQPLCSLLSSGSGAYLGDGTTCGGSVCPVPGACCHPGFILSFPVVLDRCEIRFESNCSDPSLETYRGDGTDCATSSCPPEPGACCDVSGCTNFVDQTDCEAAGGTFQGDGSTCATALCSGACCRPDGTCSDNIDASSCVGIFAGVYQGDDTLCATSTCPQPTLGACCHLDGSCTDEPGGAACADDYQGDGTDCATSSCAQPPPICGDGNLDPSEDCDDGPLNSDTLADACRTDCTNARCGDGVIDAGEACDDGGSSAACESDCSLVILTGQDDRDLDGVFNVFDNCPAVPNPDQADDDENGVGDACQPCYPQLLRDGGFEEGGEGWQRVWQNGGRSVVDSQANSGDLALQMLGSERYPRLVTQTVSVDADAAYQVSTWVKTDALGGDGVTVSVNWLDTNGNSIGTDVIGQLTDTNEWTRLSARVQAPAGAAHADLELFTAVDPTGEGAAWFDDAEFICLSAACDDGDPCTDDHCEPFVGCVNTPAAETNCDDGVDNDCDGLVDAEDADCAGSGCPAGYPDRTPGQVVTDLLAAIAAGDEALVVCNFHADAREINDNGICFGSADIAAGLLNRRDVFGVGITVNNLASIDKYVRALYSVAGGGLAIHDGVQTYVVEGGRIQFLTDHGLLSAQ